MDYECHGTIAGDTAGVLGIGIPNTAFLLGHDKGNSGRAFYRATVPGGEIDEILRSNLSSEFCMEPQKVIDKVFVADRTTFPLAVYIEGDKNEYRIDLPIESVQFTADDDERKVVIDLGQIELSEAIWGE